ncbi:hypothetical protein [Halomonas hibernica]|uniref:hypothetical protein n=1 Tax=Halomonas hibernica TaxID=2591147 RepID=UPI00155652BA|nr:hypothetical protein [Halomonas hibernica]
MIKRQQIFFNNRFYKNEKELFESNNEVEGLSYETYIARITKDRSDGQPLTREEALKKPLARKTIPITYKGVTYRSSNQMFDKIPSEDKDPHLGKVTFITRVSELRASRSELKDEEIACIALNARPHEPLTLDVSHYRRREITRKNSDTQFDEIKESISDELSRKGYHS